MKEIKFKPLRRVKKTGKIVVAGYMQWHGIKKADYSKFRLVIDDEYMRLPSDEYVYDHLGNLIFFYTYNPYDLPECLGVPLTYLEMQLFYPDGYIWRIAHNCTHYNARGVDVNGTPAFSHYTQDIVARDFKDMSPFEPLTVKTVRKWLGWFLYQLENSDLKIGL